jgi:hypothetical protein
VIRILCDRCVDQQYVNTFEQTDWITMIRAGDVFPNDAEDADDGEISAYAEQYEWVVFTEDDHFRTRHDHNRGVILYHHIEQPSPGTVVEAIRTITEVYDDHREIEEYVPGGWV